MVWSFHAPRKGALMWVAVPRHRNGTAPRLARPHAARLSLAGLVLVPAASEVETDHGTLRLSNCPGW